MADHPLHPATIDEAPGLRSLAALLDGDLERAIKAVAATRRSYRFAFLCRLTILRKSPGSGKAQLVDRGPIFKLSEIPGAESDSMRRAVPGGAAPRRCEQRQGGSEEWVGVQQVLRQRRHELGWRDSVTGASEVRSGFRHRVAERGRRSETEVAALVDLHRRCREEARWARCEAQERAVRDAVASLVREGVYPSAKWAFARAGHGLGLDNPASRPCGGTRRGGPGSCSRRLRMSLYYLRSQEHPSPGARMCCSPVLFRSHDEFLDLAIAVYLYSLLQEGLAAILAVQSLIRMARGSPSAGCSSLPPDGGASRSGGES